MTGAHEELEKQLALGQIDVDEFNRKKALLGSRRAFEEDTETTLPKQNTTVHPGPDRQPIQAKAPPTNQKSSAGSAIGGIFIAVIAGLITVFALRPSADDLKVMNMDREGFFAPKMNAEVFNTGKGGYFQFYVFDKRSKKRVCEGPTIYIPKQAKARVRFLCVPLTTGASVYNFGWQRK